LNSKTLPLSLDARPKKVRSKVTNGKSLFADADGRGVWARRFRDLVEAHVADLGGPEVLSEAKKQLVKRCATLETELERMEGELAEGKSVDLDLFGRTVGNLRRTLEAIGIDRVAKDVTPNLADLIARQRG
jgi:hypothetical protein